MSAADLIDFWSRASLDQPPYIHPEDRKALGDLLPDVVGQGLELRLLPQPWIGPLRRAKVFLLQLNPGLDGVEVAFEEERPDFREALRRNLGGDEDGLFLQPDFSSHPGAKWVKQRCKGVAPVEQLARDMAQLELVPYHSKRFGMPARIRRALLSLPSVEMMRRFVHDELLPKTVTDKATVVAMRSRKDWGLETTAENPNLVIYRGWECRNGHVTMAMRGGKAIAPRLARSRRA